MTSWRACGVPPIRGASATPARSTLLRLVVCLERATRLLQFLVGLDKEYLATVRVGFATDTQDYTGKQITPLESSELLSGERIKDVLKDFVGPKWQTRPLFSAKKVAGERLYVAAREGREVEREPVAI